MSARLGRSFPYGTLIVNLSGAAVLGFLTGLALGPEEALLAGTAAVGSYTTFSTWMFETQRLGEDRQVRHLVANLAVSLLAGVAARRAGRWIGVRSCDRGLSQAHHLLRRAAPRSTGGSWPTRRWTCSEEHGIASSILLRGVEGFGLKHHLRSDRLLSLSEDLPVVSVAIDTRPRIEAVLDELRTVQHTGLVTLERARMLRGEIGPVALPEDLHEATKLTIYVGRRERVDRVPAFVAVCDLLHRRGVAGATVLLGVDGTAHGERTRARFFAGNADVPMMIIAVGAGERDRTGAARARRPASPDR